MKQIDKLIINSPYDEPKYYWDYDREHRSFEKLEGRRPAGYVVARPDSRGFDDPGVFVTRSPPFYLTRDYFLIHANPLTYCCFDEFRQGCCQRSHS